MKEAIFLSKNLFCAICKINDLERHISYEIEITTFHKFKIFSKEKHEELFSCAICTFEKGLMKFGCSVIVDDIDTYDKI